MHGTGELQRNAGTALTAEMSLGHCPGQAVGRLQGHSELREMPGQGPSWIPGLETYSWQRSGLGSHLDQGHMSLQSPKETAQLAHRRCGCAGLPFPDPAACSDQAATLPRACQLPHSQEELGMEENNGG